MTGRTSGYTFKEKVFISLAPSGGGLIGIIVNSSFMKFYTDFIGLSPAVYGIIFLIFSIWNAVNDPLIGYWADRRPFLKGKGKYIPLIRWAVPVIAFSTIAMLYASPDWPQMLTAAYLLAGLIVYEAGQTMFGISFRAFHINAFLSMDERTEVQVIQKYINMIPAFLGGLLPAWFMTGSFSLRTVSLIYTGGVVLGSFITWFSLKFMQERPEFYDHMEVTEGMKSLLKLTGELFRNRAFITFVLAFFIINGVSGSYFNAYLYYMDNVLEVSGIWSVIPDVFTGIVQMILYPVIIIAVAKWGSRDSLSVALFAAAAGHAMLSFINSYWLTVAAYGIMFIGYATLFATNGPMEGILIDHIEIKTGKRQPGVIRGIMSVLMVPSVTVQMMIFTSLLTWSGYDGSVKSQSAEVVRAIKLGTGVIPAAFLLLGIILLKLFPLGRKEELEIQTVMEAKHRSGPSRTGEEDGTVPGTEEELQPST